MLAAGTLLAFTAGWAWSGVLIFLVVRRHPSSPAVASGILSLGTYDGGVFSPPAFGAAVEWAGYRAAWWGAAAALLGAAVLVFTAGRADAPAPLTDRISDT